MKYFFAFIILLAVGAGCKPKLLSGAALEKKLMETMKDYLDTTLKAGTQVTVKDVTYYTEKSAKAYLCEFHVSVHSASKDTSGLMAATISNDFSKIVRTQ